MCLANNSYKRPTRGPRRGSNPTDAAWSVPPHTITAFLQYIKY